MSGGREQGTLLGVCCVVCFYLFGEFAGDVGFFVFEFLESLEVWVFGEPLVEGLEFGFDGAALGEELWPSGERSVEMVVKEVIAFPLKLDEFRLVRLKRKQPTVDDFFG